MALKIFSYIGVGSEDPARKHRIAGIVKIDGVPGRRLVAVYDRRDQSWLASTWSDATTGTWEIVGLMSCPDNSLLVVAIDMAGNYNAEAADAITPVPSA